MSFVTLWVTKDMDPLGGGRGRTYVGVPHERSHIYPGSLTKMPETSHLPAP
jgi:hypothetical protein